MFMEPEGEPNTSEKERKPFLFREDYPLCINSASQGILDTYIKTNKKTRQFRTCITVQSADQMGVVD